MTDKTFRLFLDQGFSKCGTQAGSIRVAWELVGNAKDQAPAWNQELWGWVQRPVL